MTQSTNAAARAKAVRLFAAALLLLTGAAAQALTLTINVSGDGTTTLGTGPVEFEAGTTAFVRALPVAGAGYAFSTWQGDIGNATPTSDSINILMDQDKTIEAVFSPPGDFNLTITQAGPAPTSIVPGTGVFAYFDGQTASLDTNVDGVAVFFGGWSGAVQSTLPTASLLMDSDKAVTATYAATGFVLDIPQVNGGGVSGLGSGPHGYATGTVVPLASYALSGWRFDHWEGDIGDADPESPSINVTMDQARTVTLVLEEGNRVLTVATDGLGSGTVNPDVGEHRYFDGDTAFMQATPDPGSYFERWEGDIGTNDATNPLLSLPMNQDRSVTAIFSPAFALSIAVTGAGDTYLAPGTYYFAPDTEVPLTANPVTGGGFIEWQGDIGSENPASTTLSLIMDQDRAVTAVFKPYDWTVTITQVGTGSLSQSGTLQFFDGAVLNLAATPLVNTGYAFAGWSGDVNSIELAISLTIDSDKAITATFTQSDVFVLTLGSGTGGTTLPAPGNYAFVAGQQFQIAAQAEFGATFSEWTGDVEDLNPGANPLILTMDRSRQITASFGTAEVYELTILTTGEGSTLPPDGYTYKFLKDQTVLVIAVPDENSSQVFSRWTGDTGAADPKQNRLTLLMDRDRTVTANFGAADWYLTVAVDGVGAVVPTPGSYPFFDGDSTTLEAVNINASGYIFSHWEGDLTDQDPNAAKIDVTLDQDRTFTAVFESYDWLVNITQVGTGTIEPLGLFRVQDGTVFNLSAVRAAGSRIAFAGWSGDITSQELNVSVVIHGDTNITGTFRQSVDYLLNLTSDSGGTTDPPPGEYAFLFGQQIALSAQPELGYLFTGWAGNVPAADRQNPDIVLSMIDARNVKATFTELIEYDLNLSTTGAGSTLPPAGTTYTYLNGQTLTVTATADEGSGEFFVRWEGDIGSANPKNPSLPILMDQDRNITAVFAAPDWSLSLDALGAGTVDPEPGVYAYYDGEIATLTATPDASAGFVFVGWEGDIADQNAASPTIALNMTQDRSVLARFEPAEAVYCQVMDDPANALLSDTGAGEAVYDQFAVAAPVGTVRWWGTFGTGPNEGPWSACTGAGDFEIKFYTDNGGAPGAPVYAETFTGVAGVDAGVDVQGVAVQEFSATLGNAVTLGIGWISIRGLNGSSCPFRWVETNVDDDSHLRQLGTASPEALQGDAAFCLILGEVAPVTGHAADANHDGQIELSELLRVIQFYNLASYSCDDNNQPSEDGYEPGSEGTLDCAPHSSDYAPQDWHIELSELLRLIQFYANVGFIACPNAIPPTEDGFCILNQ